MTKLDTGPVTPAEAREIARRYNASHFRGRGDLGEEARYSIPADPRRDDDLRLDAFISQAEEARAENARSRAELADLPRLRSEVIRLAAELARMCSWDLRDGREGLLREPVIDVVMQLKRAVDARAKAAPSVVCNACGGVVTKECRCAECGTAPAGGGA